MLITDYVDRYRSSPSHLCHLILCDIIRAYDTLLSQDTELYGPVAIRERCPLTAISCYSKLERRHITYTAFQIFVH